MTVPRRQLSSNRKHLYYAGMALTVIGLLLFFSTFVTFAANFGNFDNFQARARSSAFRAFGGIACVMLGRVSLLAPPIRRREPPAPAKRRSGN